MEKKIPISIVLDSCNEILASRHYDKEQRKAICLLIENILHEANSYKGFGYLSKFQLDKDLIPGVNYDEKGQILDMPERFENTDEYRRFYY